APASSTPPVPPSTSSTPPAAVSAPQLRDGTVADVIMLDEDGWPDWLRAGFDHMESKQLGKPFVRALEWWTVLERAYDFATSVSCGLSAKGRPSEVGDWLRIQRRELDKFPIIKNESAYMTSWWKWWSGIQPEWRRQAGQGRPAIGGDGDWECLTNPGKNGMFIVLISLVWWREQATAQTLDDWAAAVADVEWVIASM
ncbi:uncharacterized protein TRAVEDRAFT_81082, partial [Trametes versicolor FP-101664 SS1]|uniref:uncharacterized protein n=1 Tax=Trametes versicolor (strain FP-101664) TaxID=717944 RepID=UPI00046212BF